MSSSYRAVFARTGAGSLALSCGLGWLSFAGYGLAVVLAVEAATGSFAVAGTAIAAFAAGSGLLAPARGRIVDARGARILPAFALLHAAGLALLVAGCAASWAPALLVVAAGLAGTATPPLIATARSVWPHVTGPELVRAGHAVNAALGDAASVLAPAFVGAVAALVSPIAALALLAPGVLTGAFLLAAIAPPRAGAPPRPPSHVLWGVLSESAGLRVVMVCELLLGCSFGALDVAAPVIGAEAGAAALAALPLAAFAVGSVGVSLWSGTDRLQQAPATRYVAGCGIVAAVLLLALAVSGLVTLTLVLLAAGAGYGLLNVALFELIEDLVAPDRAVEAFTWLTTCAGAGIAGGAALAGNSGAPLVVVALSATFAAIAAASARTRLGAGRSRMA